MARAAEEKVIEGSGNVFADLGFENPEQMLVKAKLVHAISSAIRSKRLTQAKVASLIGIDQPQVSKLLRGRTAGYSTDRLIRILNLLGQDVEISVKAKKVRAIPAGRVYITASIPNSRPLGVAERQGRTEEAGLRIPNLKPRSK